MMKDPLAQRSCGCLMLGNVPGQGTLGQRKVPCPQQGWSQVPSDPNIPGLCGTSSGWLLPPQSLPRTHLPLEPGKNPEEVVTPCTLPLCRNLWNSLWDYSKSTSALAGGSFGSFQTQQAPGRTGGHQHLLPGCSRGHSHLEAAASCGLS